VFGLGWVTVPTLTIAKDVITLLLAAVTEGGPDVSLDHFFVHIDGSDSPIGAPSE
jgi:hypothetical protein